VIERVRDGVEIVGQVSVVGGSDIQIHRFQLDENDRQSVDETNQVGASVVMGRAKPLDLQFADGHKTILLRFPEIDHRDQDLPLLTLVVAVGHRHPVADHFVELPVVLGA